MPDTISGRVRKSDLRRVRYRKKVRKMMAVMQKKEPVLPTEFLVTGRTGRRNAMPDILDPPHAGTTIADLPERLQQLATNDPDEPQPTTSTAVSQMDTDKNVEGSAGTANS